MNKQFYSLLIVSVAITTHLPTKSEIKKKIDLKDISTVEVVDQAKTEEIKSPIQTVSESGLNFAPKKEKKIITVKNGITKEMITYHHSTGKYKPKFNLEVNGKVLKRGKSVDIEIEPNNTPTLDARWSYNFTVCGWSYRKGEDTVTCKIDPEKKEQTIKFSWKEDPRVILE